MVTSKKAAVLFVLTSCLLPVFSYADDGAHERDADKSRVQVGPRPFYLVDKMSPARSSASWRVAARVRSARRTFLIGHRGGALCNFRSTQGKP